MPNDIIDYSNTVFYKIYCKNTEVKDLYIGHTTNFVQRKYAHKRTSIKENDRNHHLKVYKCIRDHGGWDNWKMDIIGFHDCYDHYEARKIEQNYFETLHATLNSIEPLPKPKPRPNSIPKAKQEKQIWYCDVCKTTCITNKAFITHKETKKHKRNSDVNTSNNNGEQKTPKVAEKFICEKCNFGSSKKSDYSRHLTTAKHLMTTGGLQKNSKTLWCDCGKSYSCRQNLYRHKTKCNYQKEETPKVKTEDTSNTDMANMTNLFIMFLKSQSEISNNIDFKKPENKNS